MIWDEMENLFTSSRCWTRVHAVLEDAYYDENGPRANSSAVMMASSS